MRLYLGPECMYFVGVTRYDGGVLSQLAICPSVDRTYVFVKLLWISGGIPIGGVSVTCDLIPPAGMMFELYAYW